MERFITAEECQALIDKAVADAILKIGRAPRPFKIFGLRGTQEYAQKVATHLGVKLTPHTEKTFEDGECYVKSGAEHDDSQIGNVRGHNVFVIQSLYEDGAEVVSTKLDKLLQFIGSLKDASAHEVTAVVPYLSFARQDRKTESRAPITTKYIAQRMEAAGTDRVLLFDVHNLAAAQNAFRIPIDNLEAKGLLAQWCARGLAVRGCLGRVQVLTPDYGGLSRCERFRNSLVRNLKAAGVSFDDVGIVMFDKVRVKGEVRGGRIVGDVRDSEVIALDDIISTGATMRKACRAVLDAGGRVFAICATHGLFCGRANEVFGDFDCPLVVTDTIEAFRLNEANRLRLHVVDTTRMVADAVRRIHSGTGSISELLRG